MITALLTITLALPPSGDTSRVSLTVSADFTYFALSYPATTGPFQGDGHTVQGDGEFSALFFLGRPVVDDETPISLQPFLQRVSGVSVGGGGGGYTLTSAGFDRHGSAGNAWIDLAGYPRRGLYLGADVGVRYETWQDSLKFDPTPLPSRNTLALPLSVGVGVRTGDLLLDVVWSISPRRTDGGSFSVPFWGGASLRARAVVEQDLWIVGSVALVDKGAGGSVLLEQFLGRQLSGWISANGGHSSETDSGASFDWVGVSAGGSCWFSHRLGITLSYAPTWMKAGNPDPRSVVEHVLTLSMKSRL